MMLSQTRAKEIAENALTFIAADDALTSAMLAASGLEADDLRQAAGHAEFNLFLLDFILQDDDRVRDFAADQQIRPESVLYARDLLSYRAEA